jgi:hypothetical protein
MTPEREFELRTTVASLRVKTSCQELLIMALLPMLAPEQKAAIRGCSGHGSGQFPHSRTLLSKSTLVRPPVCTRAAAPTV